MKVKIIKSLKRKRTVSARLIKDTLEIRVPLLLPSSEIDRVTGIFLGKVQAQKSIGTNAYLAKRAVFLYKKYFRKNPPSFEIFWSKKQQKGYGVCYPKTKTIRISYRLAKIPLWVLDYVLIHEFTHLFHQNHSSRFWQMVEKYPKAERARGFLQGMDFGKTQ